MPGPAPMSGDLRGSTRVIGRLSGWRAVGPGHIAQRRLQRLDIQTDRAIAGKRQQDPTGAFSARFKGNRQKRQDRVLVVAVNAVAGHVQDVVDDKQCAHALGAMTLAPRVLPAKPVQQERETPLPGKPAHLGHREYRILQKGRYDLQILGIHGTKVQRCFTAFLETRVLLTHWPEILSIFAPTLPSFSSTL